MARAHGGGGHKNAAGCSVRGDLKDVQDRFLRLLASALDG
jgi:nanoRNase/pAp phosphatase (c-di-AMP/oligoRNAs hydrolase)